MGSSFVAKVLRVLVAVLGVFVVATAVVYSAGTMSVYVREKRPDGHRIWIPVPALLLKAGLWLVPDDALRQASSQVRPWLPAMTAAAEELRHCPDTVFIEVKDPADHVTISKQGNSLVIDADSKDETVHVSLPVSVMASVARRFRIVRAPA